MEQERNFLIFETPTVEGRLISAAEIKKLILDKLDKEQPTIDLVILQACHSEIIGKVFREHCAKHVICINQKSKVQETAV